MTKTSDFTLTIPGLTLDQLTAIAAYADGLKVNGNVKAMATDTPAPAPTPARDLPDGGASRMYPTNPDGTLNVAAPAPTPQPAPAPAPVGNAASLAASNVAAADRDAFGVPYHSSFHADRGGKTKGRNNDGSWKMKKNVDRAAYDQYRAQFKTDATPAPTPTSQPAAPAPVPTPAQLNAQFAPGVPPQGATIPAPAPLGAPAPMVAPLAAAPAPALESVTYDQLIALYNEVCQSGAVTQDQLNAIHAEAQADPTSLDYANHADKRALAYARLSAFRVPVAA
jgi:hypothetical protein